MYSTCIWLVKLSSGRRQASGNQAKGYQYKKAGHLASSVQARWRGTLNLRSCSPPVALSWTTDPDLIWVSSIFFPRFHVFRFGEVFLSFSLVFNGFPKFSSVLSLLVLHVRYSCNLLHTFALIVQWFSFTFHWFSWIAVGFPLLSFHFSQFTW